MKLLWNRIAARRLLPPLAIIAAIQLYALAMYTRVDGAALYGTDDNLFYFWRYGAFSLFGYMGGALLFLVPFEKIRLKWTRKKMAVILGVLVLLCAALLCLLISERERQVFHWLDWHTSAADQRASEALLDSPKYFYAYRAELWRDAPLWGNAVVDLHPYYTGIAILAHSLRAFGLLPTVAVMGASLALPALMVCLWRGTKPSPPRFIAMTCTAYLAVQILSGVMGTANLLPYFLHAHLPFIGYVRFWLIFDLCIVGIWARCLYSTLTKQPLTQ